MWQSSVIYVDKLLIIPSYCLKETLGIEQVCEFVTMTTSSTFSPGNFINGISTETKSFPTISIKKFWSLNN